MTKRVSGIAAAMLAAIVSIGCTPSQPAPGAAGAAVARARSAIGGPCDKDADCEAGATCDKDDPGGQCTKKCAVTADCGPGNVCRPDEKECFQGCHGQADCKRAGYVCMGTAPETFCDVPESAEKH